MQVVRGISGVVGLMMLVGMMSASVSGNAAASSGNPLIGPWKLVDPQCDVTEVIYTPNSYAGFEGPSGIFPGWHRLSAGYTVSVEEIWVHAGGGDQRVI